MNLTKNLQFIAVVVFYYYKEYYTLFQMEQ